MSDPMEQFKGVFFEECSELLVSLEEGLMLLQQGDQDAETMNAVFRSVHSIKGGAGAFGFDALVAFAHIQETLLDEMRSGTIVMEPEYIDVLLQAYDILCELVGAAQREEDVDEDYGAKAALAMKEPDNPCEEVQGINTRHFKISFKPFEELYQRANEPILLIRELGDLGDLTVKLDTSDMPDIAEMEAELAYFSWEFSLATEFGEETIEEVFEFVEGDCELIIKEEESTLTQKGADITIRALELGAVDYVAKPLDQDLTLVGQELILKIKVASNARIRQSGRQRRTTQPRTMIKHGIYNRKLIAIGSSTGGVESLYDIISKLPR